MRQVPLQSAGGSLLARAEIPEEMVNAACNFP